MAQACQWPAPVPLSASDLEPQRFTLGGMIAGVRDTTPADAVPPALMLIVEVGGEYARILVPPEVWPAARELLQVGQWVRISGETDSSMFMHGSRQVASEVSLVARFH